MLVYLSFDCKIWKFIRYFYKQKVKQKIPLPIKINTVACVFLEKSVKFAAKVYFFKYLSFTHGN